MTDAPSALPQVSIEVEADATVHHALQQNDVPLVKLLRVRNDGATELRDVTVELTLGDGLAARWTRRIDRLPAGATHNFETVDLRLDPDALRARTEREKAALRAVASTSDGELARVDVPVEVLAFQEWPGLASLPALLASFVLPNHPAVDGLLARASTRLRQATGDGALVGYQTKDPARVRATVAAVFQALCDCEIAYATPPASFETDGQRVRLPDQVLDARLGTCLDLALLYAAVLEQAGVRPLVALTEGHAFVGAWLVPDEFHEVADEDGLRLRKRVDLGEVVVVEATMVAVDGGQQFERAVEAARRHLEDLGRFRAVVDVAAARKARFLPLPVRAEAPRSGLLPPRVAAAAPAPARELVPEPAAAPSPFVAAPSAETPASRLDRWKRKLLDLGLRNRLINFRETRHTIRVVAPDLGVLEDALQDGGAFALRPRPEPEKGEKVRDAALHLARTGEDLTAALCAEELRARRLVADLVPDELDRRLLEIWRHARLAIEESGANTLYLALGTLLWYEAPSSQEPRRAPILLLPLAIERVSALEGFRVRLADDDPRVNVTLLEKLKAEFPVDVRGLDELVEDAQGLDVVEILRRFRRAILHVDRWDVRDEAWIAPFSFTKFLMWLDLQERAERLLESPVLSHLVERPGAAFEPGEVFPEPDQLDETLPVAETLCPLDADSSQLAAVRAAHQGRSFVLEGPPGTGKSQTITNLIAQCVAHGKRVLFVSEKMAALDVVRRRLEQVGLGPFCLELHSSKASKRQVLEQLVAAFDATAAGAPAEWERRAQRLEETRRELNGYVRAIHQPRAFGESVFRVTSLLCGMRDVPRVELDLGVAIDGAWVAARREAVDRLATAGDAIGHPSGHPLRALRRGDWEATLGDRLDRACADGLAALARLDAAAGGVAEPLGVDARELRRGAFADLVEAVRLALDTPGPGVLALTEPGFDDLRARMLAFVEDVRQKDALRAHVRVAFADRVLDLDLDALLAELRRGIGSIWPLSWLRCRKVRKVLRGAATGGHLGTDQELVAHLEQAVDLRARIRALADPAHPADALFGARNWNGGDPGGEEGARRLADLVDWVGRLRAVLLRLAGAAPEAAPLRARLVGLATDGRDALQPGARAGDAMRALDAASAGFQAARDALDDLMDVDDEVAWTPQGGAWLAHCRATLEAWRREQRARLDDWCHWRHVRAEALGLELAPVVVAFERDEVPARALPAVFERGFREAWLNAVTDAEDALRSFHGREHERRIRRFAELDQELIRTTRDVVASRLCAQVPRASERASDSSEVGIVMREARKKTRHLPVRRLFQAIPNLLPRIKPCLLMSPLSVAQYLTPELAPFDLVVFDEASQITPWDAVGAIARGRACVVVGDTRQLPPTSFFQAVEGEDAFADELDFEDLESILDECAAAGLRPMRLRWHYRSRHESLIAFSNYHYYGNGLLTFPGAEDVSARMGVSLVRVPDGVYDRSKSRTNRKEAESVVADVVARLRVRGAPEGKESVGIVTFSQAQQQLVEDLLDDARRKDPALEPYFTGAVQEPVFVKNLENVQGDERDVILFSIGYGPDEAGKVAMNFGPLNVAGGERRLNVAITRARRQVVVHATLRPEHIDLARTNALGVKHLKAFLDYAARGPAAIAEATALDGGAEFDSPFEQQVSDALVARGHDVARQVGCSGFRIDLAVRDPELPGRFLLGIECDGAFYHSAKTARDRDRLREAVLGRLGWTLCRVWSTDWWRSPDKEIERIERALREARRAAPPEPAAATAPEPAAAPEVESEPPSEPAPAPEAVAEPAASLPPGASVYRAADLATAEAPDDLHLPSATPALRAAAVAVLAAEGPIHTDLLCRRIAVAFGTKLTPRVRKRILDVVAKLPAKQRPAERGAFLWPPELDPAAWRGYRLPAAEDGSSARAADELAPEECANAALAVLAEQVALPRADLARETARRFGFARMGARVEAAMSAGIELLIERGAARDDDGMVVG